jgi:hypothetical protein
MDAIGQSIWNTLGSNVEFKNDFPDTVIGIDFGSSNSCMAVWRADKNRVKIIRNMSLESKYSSIIVMNVFLNLGFGLFMFFRG